jgi:hypothetical protein
LHVYPGDSTSWLYEDDGQSLEYQGGGYKVTSFQCQRGGENGLTVTRQAQGAYCPPYRRWKWHIHGLASKPEQVLVDGQALLDVWWCEATDSLEFESGEVQRIETR